MKITTFNCENLFARYGFLDRASATPGAANKVNYSELIKVVDVGSLAKAGGVESLAIQSFSDKQRRNTAATIQAAAPDILCLNEVENLDVVRLFNARFLDNAFDRILLFDGNDARGINVALLVRRGAAVEIEGLRSHADDAIAGGFLLKSNRLDTKVVGSAVYSRDCLEVDVKAGKKALTLLVNHLKAQEIRGGADKSTPRRLGQATHLAGLVDAVRRRKRLPIVLGDCNKDTRDPKYDGSLDPVVQHPALADPFPRFVAPEELWSHYYSGDKKTSRLDYILVDKRLTVTAAGFVRGGLTPKCKQYTGARFNDLKDGEEASDHCPTSIELTVE